MTLLTQSEADQVAAAIAEVESQTDAELVTVLAKQADNYHYIPTLWAALIALVSPGIFLLTPFWLDVSDLLLLQLVSFFVFALLLRIPFVLRRIIPKSVKRWRAANMARRCFLENNLHHTKGESGLLIFVAETERYVEILADRGINNHVDAQVWQSIVSDFTNKLHDKQTLSGFLGAISQCGEILIRHLPTTGEKNELPNHLVVIE
ncbi:MAG: TPM domain-containing protein [Pseudomonadaceae bacterium]|nr:TPM domain-containing protein [Pseudomonadaceae bacterium]